VYPMVLPARNPLYSLTVTTAKAGALWTEGWVGLVGPRNNLGRGLLHYRSFAGKVVVDKSLRGY